jgi:putative addiction module killer protein
VRSTKDATNLGPNDDKAEIHDFESTALNPTLMVADWKLGESCWSRIPASGKSSWLTGFTHGINLKPRSMPQKVTNVLPLNMAIKVEEYIREDASNPYKQWFDGLTSQAAAKLTVAKLRMELGNTSSIKWFDGMGEYVIDWGPGYRIYLAKDGDTLIVLFGGGTKRGQQRDIDKAKALLAEYKTRKKAMTIKSSSKHKG